jgi:hypothetical protein
VRLAFTASNLNIFGMSDLTSDDKATIAALLRDTIAAAYSSSPAIENVAAGRPAVRKPHPSWAHPAVPPRRAGAVDLPVAALGAGRTSPRSCGPNYSARI